MKPYTSEFEARTLRPDSPVRKVVVANVVDRNSDGSLRASLRQKRDDWALADGAAAGPPPTLAGFSLVDNGDVRLSDTITTLVTKAGPPNAYFSDLDRTFPYNVILVQWNGPEPNLFEIQRVKIWLNPRVSGALNRQVAKWKLDFLAVIEDKGSGLMVLAPIVDAMTVDVTSDAEGLVTFDYSATPINKRPQPKWPFPANWPKIDPSSNQPTPLSFGHYATFLVVTALDKDGNAATNAGMGYDSGTPSVTTAGNTLSSRILSVPFNFPANTPLTRLANDGGIGAGCPIVTIDYGAYTSATISFTTNPLNLGGAPAGDVQLVGRGHVPTGCAIVYRVRNDADSAWIDYTDGQWMIADLGLTPTQSRKFQAALNTNAGANLTPVLTGLGMESISEVIFLRQTKVDGGNWAIDPQTLKGEIPEVLISFIRDGDRDYTSAIEDLLANNHIGDIRFRVYWGDEGLGRKDWLLDDEFLIDGSHPRGPEIRLKCLSVLCLLRDLVPRFSPGSAFQPTSDTLVGAWTTESGGAVNLYSHVNEVTPNPPGFDDTTYIRSDLDPVNSAVEVKLPTVADPAGRRILVDYRYRKDATSGEQIDLTVQLRQGTTVIVQQIHTNIDTDSASSATPFTLQLTDAQIAGISDYTDLRLRFIANKPSGAGSRRAIITWCQVRTGGKQTQVTYTGTLKACYDGLLANELGIDGRYRGPGIEDIQSINQVSKTMFQASGASNKPLGKQELDALAYIAGGGITSSQGKITFRDMFNASRIVAVFPSSEINLDEAGPGYEERMPQLFATWKWNAAKGDFDRQEYVAHAGALLHLGQARLDPPKWFDVEMAKWLSLEGLDGNGVTLAGRVGVRQVQALGPGLMLWPFTTNYRFPWIEPGDAILLQTDKFVGRDPNLARAIRGAQWVIAVIQSRDSTARRFTPWVRNYSDMLAGTPQAGDRNGLGPATPHIMALKAFIDDGGNASAIATTAAAAAIRYATSTAGVPSDATVRAAALQVVDGSGSYSTGNVLALTPGQTFYIKAFAYEKADGSGLESPSVSATITMGTRKRIFAFDDGFIALKASDTVGKETNDDLFVSDTKTVKVGTVASPSVKTKTIRIPAQECVPSVNTEIWFIGGSYLTSNDLNECDMVASLVMPKGVTLTKVRARMYRNAVGDLAVTTVVRSDDTGAQTAIATLTHNTTGWQTVEATLSQLIGDEMYTLIVNVDPVASTADARFLWFEAEYTMPDYSKSY
jgi:hypothetical protein